MSDINEVARKIFIKDYIKRTMEQKIDYVALVKEYRRLCDNGSQTAESWPEYLKLHGAKFKAMEDCK